MQDYKKKIRELDVSVFDFIESQTSKEERKSLLAVQNVYAEKYKEYIYLEIGSHLGGSIQPHLIDDRCKKIYSIDPRPEEQPDDRSSGYIATYYQNSTERMLELLKGIGCGDIDKVKCFESDASMVHPEEDIVYRPYIILIDGEHTKKAVLSDFNFCKQVVHTSGVILFHDFHLIHPAISEICYGLNSEGKKYKALKLDGSLFALFFEPEMISMSHALKGIHDKNSNLWPLFQTKQKIKKYIPNQILSLIQKLVKS